MGQSIQFDRLAASFPATDTEIHSGDYYLLVHEIGNSNSFDHDGNIARDWRFCTVGTEADVIADVATAARDIERGMIRYQNGKTKTENYIKNWRKELHDDTVMSVDEFTTRFHLAELVVSQPKKINDLQETPGNQPDGPSTVFDTIRNSWRRTTPDDEDRPIYRADIAVETLRQFETMADETRVWIDF